MSHHSVWGRCWQRCSSLGGFLARRGAPECNQSGSRLRVCLSRAAGKSGRGRVLELGWGRLSMWLAGQAGGVTAQRGGTGPCGGGLWACGGAQTLGC